MVAKIKYFDGFKGKGQMYKFILGGEKSKFRGKDIIE